MCTTRSDMVLASLFSSIILSNPSALVEPRMLRFLECCDDDEECVEPSRLGVGVFDRDRLGVGVPLLLLGGLGTSCAFSPLGMATLSLSWERAAVAAALDVGVDGRAGSVECMKNKLHRWAG